MPSGYIYSWTGKVSSSYGTAGNWYNNNAGATATSVPGTSDEALVVASGAINGPGAAFELGLTGTATGLTAGGSLFGSYVYVGGTISLASGGAIGSNNLIDIGDNSAYTIAGRIPTLLTVGPNSFISATLATPNTFDVLVGSNGGTGTLAVAGAGAIASSGTEGFWVGSGGTGLISVGSGGFIEGGTPFGSGVKQIDLALGSYGGSGTLAISGASSGATFSNTAEVGFGGTGVLSVAAGGVFYAGEGVDSLNIGDNYNGSVGNGAVAISASNAYLAGLIEVGAYGQGSLTLSNGAYVDDYFATPRGAASPSWSALIGVNAGSNGTLSVTSSSYLQAAEGIAVGTSGTGALNVSSATVNIDAAAATGTVALDVGVASGSTGTVTVSAGLIDDAAQAGMVVGGGGTGSMVISQSGSQGGTVLTGSALGGAGLTVGASGGSSGAITVTGTASALGVLGEVADGATGQGSISVGAGARMVIQTGLASSGLVLGGSGGSGALSLAGGALTAVTGQTDIGEFGTGTLSVTGGGGFSGQTSGTPAMVVGSSAGSTGSVLVSDPYSYASLTGGLDVGSAGAGRFTAQNQSLVVVGGTSAPTVPAILIGASANARGTVSVASQSEMYARGAGVAVGSSGAGELDVSNATLTVTVAPGAGVYAVNAGIAAGSTGLVNVSGGLIFDTQSAGMIIGDAGSGTLSISQAGSQGGLVLTGNPSGNAGVAVGVGAGSSGTVSVSGTASGLVVYGTVDDGVSGQGSITLVNGGHLVVNLGPSAVGLQIGGTGGSGVLSVGSGAQAYVVGQSVVGYQGNGALTVTGNSSLTGTSSGVPAMVVGAASTGTGSVLISDPGSYISLTGGLVVGNTGNATLAVENSALLGVNGSTGATLPGVILGNNAGSFGMLSLTTKAGMRTTTGIAVGNFGSGDLLVSTSTLTINDSPGSGVAAIDVGVSTGSSGVVDVNGGLIEDVQSAGMIVGDTGSGTLAITQVGSAGGIVLTGQPNAGAGLLVGNTASATGSVSVSGAASGLGVYGEVEVGASGVGAISLSSQARMSAGYSTGAIGLLLGTNAGGIGNMTIAGGAQVVITGETVVGQLGSGFLSIAGGSSFTGHSTSGTALVIGASAGSTGDVVISDAQTYVPLTGDVLVGAAGTGTLAVENGALLTTSGDVSIGGYGSATATVTGVGSRWSVAGYLSVGNNTGTALLDIAAGADVTAASVNDDANPFGHGGGTIVVTGAGSELTTGSITIGNGGDFANPGTLLVQSGGVVDDSGSISVYGTLDVAGGTLTSAGTVGVSIYLGSVTSRVLDSGFIQIGALNNGGTITVSSGTLSCLGSATGLGDITISANGAFNLGGSLGSEQFVSFGAGGGTLTALSTTSLASSVSGWSAGDFIDLKSLSASSESYANGTLSLFGASNHLVGTLAVSGNTSLTSSNFSLSALGSSGTVIAYHS